jgi:hypothetical protein
LLVEEVLIVERALEEELVVLGLAEGLGYLRDAPVVVGVFERAGSGFRGLVGGDIAELLSDR